MSLRTVFATALTMGTLFSGTAFAAECSVNTGDPYELSGVDVTALYDCIKDTMIEGYTKGDNEIAAIYRGWTVTSTRPAVVGMHGDRLLQTFANDIAVEQYLKFEDEGVVMSAGSILAKESIKIKRRDKIATVGPLFIMEKAKAGGAPETDDWLYSAVQPNGKPMKIKQSFCHDCHTGFADRDFLGYPLEEVRVSN